MSFSTCHVSIESQSDLADFYVSDNKGLVVNYTVNKNQRLLFQLTEINNRKDLVYTNINWLSFKSTVFVSGMECCLIQATDSGTINITII